MSNMCLARYRTNAHPLRTRTTVNHSPEKLYLCLPSQGLLFMVNSLEFPNLGRFALGSFPNPRWFVSASLLTFQGDVSSASRTANLCK